MKVALVLNGEPPSKRDLTLLDGCDAIICADGAAKWLLEADRAATRIVGDLDSLDPAAYKWADALEIPIDRHPQEKDVTDGELALQSALEMGPHSILIIGGHGKRTAMFLGNVKLLRRCHDEGLDAVMVGNNESLRFVSAGDEAKFDHKEGGTLNVLAVEGDIRLTVTGTDYDVEELVLSHRSCRGVSNPVTGDRASVRVLEGTAIVILEEPEEE